MNKKNLETSGREARRRRRVYKLIDSRTSDKSRTLVISCIAFFVLTNAITLYIATK